MSEPSPSRLLTAPLGVVNIGLSGFAQELASAGVPVTHVDWMPPAGGDAELAGLLARLSGDEAIETANREAVGRILSGEPVLIDVVPAVAAIPALAEGRTILHAGPPIEWARMCGPMQGAIRGAIVFEGWAPDLAAAEKLAAAGGVTFHPNHHFDAVGPMTGLTTRSMPVLVVENRKFGNRATCAINEGLGKVMRFGGNDAEVLARLAWLRDVLGPAMAKALRARKGVPLKPLIARGLSMGDEMHQRNVACTGLFLREIAPWLARTSDDGTRLAEALAFIAGNDQFFLNIAMALGKAMTDPARNIANSSIVTAMCRNGTDFGIRVSGTGDTWFTAPVEMPVGLYFAGFSAADANPDMGDSAIVETIGLGGFAMAAAPAVVGFIGAGSAADAAVFTQTMHEITAAENPEWTIPALDFAGVATGIDVRLVAETGIAPTINTGIAHRKPGVGQVGAGVVRAPMACFTQAARALAAKAGGSMSASVLNAVRRGFYLDSVALMRLSREVAAMPGVQEAALMMATPANKRILADAGLLAADSEGAAANDLVLAVRADTADAATAALSVAAASLEKPRGAAKGTSAQHPRTLRAALRAQPGATLALISVPGDYAAGEARKALRAGLDVMIFSDNVPVAEEVALKREAKALGRLVMGPDCGTAIIDGVPLAFANRVPRGDIGIIGASGTGTQEVTCLIAQGGQGISQAIGVGGRDLAREVGALSTLAAIDLLDADPATRRIVLISKPPHPEVARAVLARVGKSRKPFTICFLGAADLQVPANARAAPTLRAAAEDALGAPIGLARDAALNPAPRPGAILGLYSGGTLGAEAQLILLAAGRSVAANAAVPGAKALEGAARDADRIVDLGADEYTRGRPHPMIDPAVRTDKLRAALADTSLAVILLDVVIGFGAHADPAGEIAAALAGVPPGRPYVVASVTGTEADPQVRSRQVATLEAAGVLVAPSNAGAAELALALVQR